MWCDWVWFHNWYCEKGVRHFDCIIWKKNVLTCVPGIIVGYSSYDGLWADFWQWYGVWSACIMWLPEQIFNCIYNNYNYCSCMYSMDNIVYCMNWYNILNIRVFMGLILFWISNSLNIKVNLFWISKYFSSPAEHVK